jgi:hypothetical protein
MTELTAGWAALWAGTTLFTFTAGAFQAYISNDIGRGDLALTGFILGVMQCIASAIALAILAIVVTN